MSMKRIVTGVMAGSVVVVMSAASGLAAQMHKPQHAAADKAKAASGMAAKDHAMMAEDRKSVV